MTILPQIEQQLREAAERRAVSAAERRGATSAASGRSTRRRLALARMTRATALAGVALAAVLGLLAFAMAGGEGDRQFDVAAAVYRAIAPGTGVRYVVTEQETRGRRFHAHSYVQRWSTRDPARERVIWREQRNYGRERLWRGESATTVGGTSWDWGSNEPRVMLRKKGVAILKEQLDTIRAVHRSGLLRVIGKTTLKGRKLYRLQAPRMTVHEVPNELLVDAKTFIPVEDINYRRASHGRLIPVFILRYRTFEELPATPANLAKLNMASHPGTRIVTHRR